MDVQGRRLSLGEEEVNSQVFKKGIKAALTAIGFAQVGKSMARRGTGVTCLVTTEKGFGSQWFINVGLWIEALGHGCPELVEQTHLYFRLERLFPEHHLIITNACMLDGVDQQKAYDQLLVILREYIGLELQTLCSESGLRQAMRDGRFTRGLVRKEARDWLAGTTPPRPAPPPAQP